MCMSNSSAVFCHGLFLASIIWERALLQLTNKKTLWVEWVVSAAQMPQLLEHFSGGPWAPVCQNWAAARFAQGQTDCGLQFDFQ